MDRKTEKETEESINHSREEKAKGQKARAQRGEKAYPKSPKRPEARRLGNFLVWALSFVVISLCLRRAEAGRYLREADAIPIKENGATTKELKGIESYNGHAALLLSSSTRESAQSPEQILFGSQVQRPPRPPTQGKRAEPTIDRGDRNHQGIHREWRATKSRTIDRHTGPGRAKTKFRPRRGPPGYVA